MMGGRVGGTWPMFLRAEQRSFREEEEPAERVKVGGMGSSTVIP